MNKVLMQLEKYLPNQIFSSILILLKNENVNINEIRMRLHRYSTITLGHKNVILLDREQKPILLSRNDIQKTFRMICENSLYKYENEIKNGYITLENGCRVGFCGTKSDGGMLKDISSLNFRLAHQVDHAADYIFPLLYNNGKVFSSLILSEPGGGKTTILSDISYKLCQKRLRVSIVDERGEIAATHGGIPQKNVGQLADVLDGYNKGEGMLTALRTLSPQVIICDEIGSKQDVFAMIEAMNAGVPVIASAHADKPQNIQNRPQLKALIENNAIDKFFFLQGATHPGQLNKVLSLEEMYEIIGNHSVV